jgi:hypothetical protein
VLLAIGNGESMMAGDGESMAAGDGESMATGERAGESIDPVVPTVGTNWRGSTPVMPMFKGIRFMERAWDPANSTAIRQGQGHTRIYPSSALRRVKTYVLLVWRCIHAVSTARCCNGGVGWIYPEVENTRDYELSVEAKVGFRRQSWRSLLAFYIGRLGLRILFHVGYRSHGRWKPRSVRIQLSFPLRVLAAHARLRLRGQRHQHIFMGFNLPFDTLLPGPKPYRPKMRA